MWRDIALQNRDSILEMMDSFAEYYVRLREMVARGDGAAMERFFASSKEYRDRLVLNRES